MTSEAAEHDLTSGYQETESTEMEQGQQEDEEEEAENMEECASEGAAECNCDNDNLLLDAKSIPFPIRLSSRRRTHIDELRERVPIPRSAVPPLHYPSWPTVPLDRKIPGGVPAPNGSVVFARGTIGSKLHRRPRRYSLGEFQKIIKDYDPLHDPHARSYFCQPTVQNLLLKQGLITPDGHVKCSLKQFNHYREYLSTIYNQCLEDYIRENDNKWKMEYESNRELRLYTARKKSDSKRKSILEKLRKKKMEEFRRIRARQEKEERRRTAFEQAQYLRNVRTALVKGQESIRRRIKVNRVLYRRKMLDEILFRALLEKDCQIAERRECERRKEEEQKNMFLTEWAIAKCVNQLQRMKTDDLVERSIRQDLKEKVCKRLNRTDRKCYALFPFRECRGIYEARLKKDQEKQEERVEYLMRKYFYIWLNKVRYSCRIDAAHTSLWNIQEELRRDAVLMCNFCEQTCPPNSAVEAIMKLRPQRNMFGGTPANPPQLQATQSSHSNTDLAEHSSKSNPETPKAGTSALQLSKSKITTVPPAEKPKELHADCVLCLPLSKRSKSAGPTLYGIETLMNCTRYGVLKPHNLHPCECGNSPGSAYSTLMKFWRQQKTQMTDHLCGKCIADINVPKFCIPPEYASQRGCKPFTFPTCPATRDDYSSCYDNNAAPQRCSTHPQVSIRKSATRVKKHGQLPFRDGWTQGDQVAQAELATQSGGRADRGTQGMRSRDASQQMEKEAKSEGTAAQTSKAKRTSTAAGTEKKAGDESEGGEEEEDCEPDDEAESHDPVETGVLGKRFKAGSRKRIRCRDRTKPKTTYSHHSSITTISKSACSSAPHSRTGLSSPTKTSSTKVPSDTRGTQKDSPNQSAKVGTTLPGKSAGTETATPRKADSSADTSALKKTSGTQSPQQPTASSATSGPAQAATGAGTDKPAVRSSGSHTDEFQSDAGQQVPRPPHSAPAATGLDREEGGSQTASPKESTTGTEPEKAKTTSSETDAVGKSGAETATDAPRKASARSGRSLGRDAATSAQPATTSDASSSAGPSVDTKGVESRPDGTEMGTSATPGRKDGSTEAQTKGSDKSSGARPGETDAAVATQPTGIDKGSGVSPDKKDTSVGAAPAGVEKSAGASPSVRDGSVGGQISGQDKSTGESPQKRDGAADARQPAVTDASTAPPSTKDSAAEAPKPAGVDASADASPPTKDSDAGAERPPAVDASSTASPPTKDSAAGAQPASVDSSTTASPATKDSAAGAQPSKADASGMASPSTKDSGADVQKPSGVDSSAMASPSTKDSGSDVPKPSGVDSSAAAGPATADSAVGSAKPRTSDTTSSTAPTKDDATVTQKSPATDASATASPSTRDDGTGAVKPPAVDASSAATALTKDESTGIAKPAEIDASLNAGPSTADSAAEAPKPGGTDASATASPPTADATAGGQLAGVEKSSTAAPEKKESGAGGRPPEQDESTSASVGKSDAQAGVEPGVDQSASARPAQAATAAETEATGVGKAVSASPETATGEAAAQPETSEKSIASDAPASRDASTGGQPVDQSAQVNTVVTPTQTGATQTQTGSPGREKSDKVVSAGSSRGVSRIVSHTSRPTVSARPSAAPRVKASTVSIRPSVKKSISFKDFQKENLKPGIETFDRDRLGSVRSPRPATAPASSKPSTVSLSPSQLRNTIRELPADVRKSVSQALGGDKSKPLMKVEMPKRYQSVGKGLYGSDEGAEPLSPERGPGEYAPRLSARPSASTVGGSARPSTTSVVGSAPPSASAGRIPDDRMEDQGTSFERQSRDLDRADRPTGAGAAYPRASTIGIDAAPPEVGTADTGDEQQFRSGEVPTSRLESFREDETGTNLVPKDNAQQATDLPPDDPCLNNVTQSFVGDIIDSVASDFGLRTNEFDPCCLDEQSGRPVCKEGAGLKDICCATCSSPAAGPKTTSSKVEAPVLPMATKSTIFTPQDAAPEAMPKEHSSDQAAPQGQAQGDDQQEEVTGGRAKRRGDSMRRMKAPDGRETVEFTTTSSIQYGDAKTGNASGRGPEGRKVGEEVSIPQKFGMERAPGSDGVEADGEFPTGQTGTDAGGPSGSAEPSLPQAGTYAQGQPVPGVGTDAFGRPSGAGAQDGLPIGPGRAGGYGMPQSGVQGRGSALDGAYPSQHYGAQVGGLPGQSDGSQTGGGIGQDQGSQAGGLPGYASQGDGVPRQGYGPQGPQMSGQVYGSAVAGSGVPGQAFGPQFGGAGWPGQALGPQMSGPGAYGQGGVGSQVNAQPGQGLPGSRGIAVQEAGSQVGGDYFPGQGYGPQAGAPLPYYASGQGTVFPHADGAQLGSWRGMPSQVPYGTAPPAFGPQSSYLPYGQPGSALSPQTAGPAGGGQDRPQSAFYGTSAPEQQAYGAPLDGLSFAETAAPYKQQLVERTMAQMRNAAAQHPLSPQGDSLIPQPGLRIRKRPPQDQRLSSLTSLERELRGAYRGCCTGGPLIPMCDENMPLVEEIYLQSRQVTPISDVLTDRALRRAIDSVAGPCDPSFIEGPGSPGPRTGSRGKDMQSQGQKRGNKAGGPSKPEVPDYSRPQFGDSPTAPKFGRTNNGGQEPPQDSSRSPRPPTSSTKSRGPKTCGDSYLEIRQKIELLRCRLEQFKKHLLKSGIRCPPPVGTTEEEPPKPNSSSSTEQSPSGPTNFQSYTVETVLTSIRPTFDPAEITPPPSSLGKRVRIKAEQTLTRDPLDLSDSSDSFNEQKKKALESAGFSLTNSPETSSVQILFPQQLQEGASHQLGGGRNLYDTRTNVDPQTLTLLLTQANTYSDRNVLRGRIESMRAQLAETRQSLRHQGILGFGTEQHSPQQQQQQQHDRSVQPTKKTKNNSEAQQQLTQPESSQKKSKKGKKKKK